MDRKEYKQQWYKNNKERIRAQAHEKYLATRILKRPVRTEEDLQESRKSSWRKHNQTPIAKFRFQANNARKRGIEWHLTFDEWWKIWQDSGKWEERGKKATQYCMCRHMDQGPYAVDNVYIDTTSNNAKLVRLLNKGTNEY
jgi:hypothetical protein